MLTRDAVVVLREAMEKAVVRIRSEKLLEEQKKKEEQEKRQKEERDRADAEAAAAKASEAAKAAAAVEAAGGKNDETSADIVVGDVDAFDDLMIGKTYTDDENTSAVEANNTGSDDNDNEDDKVEMEQTQGGDEDSNTKRKRMASENAESIEVQPAKKQALPADDMTNLDNVTQSQDQTAPSCDSDSTPTEAKGGQGERLPQGGDRSDQAPFYESVRAAFHFLDRGSGKAPAPLRGYITFEELQTLL